MATVLTLRLLYLPYGYYIFPTATILTLRLHLPYGYHTYLRPTYLPYGYYTYPTATKHTLRLLYLPYGDY
jgi:hypothetical protein